VNLMMLTLMATLFLNLGQMARADSARPVSSDEMSLLSDYGKGLLRSQMGIDLDHLGNMDLLKRRSDPAYPLSPNLTGLESAQQRNMALDLNLQAGPGSLHMNDLGQGVPLAVGLHGAIQLLPNQLDLDTRVRVPLARDGGMHVDTSLKLPSLHIRTLDEILAWGGFDHPLLADWTYANEPGYSLWGTGLSTRFAGDWDLNYRWESHFDKSVETHKVGVNHHF
jgi:hypothetical protein